jgi:hypothetical protein
LMTFLLPNVTPSNMRMWLPEARFGQDHQTEAMYSTVEPFLWRILTTANGCVAKYISLMQTDS